MTTAIVGLVGVIVGSALTALLNFYLQRAADRRRWEREDELQRQHWEREDRTGLRAERIGLYRDYVAQVLLARSFSGFDDAAMRRMMYEIQLLGSAEAATWAVRLYYDAVDVDYEATVPGPESELDQAMESLESTLSNFEQAVRAEFGIPEPPPKPPPRPIKSDDE